MKSIVVDLDDTLCNTSQRQHTIWRDENGKIPLESWELFHSLCAEDEPNQDVIRMLDAFETFIGTKEETGIIIVTARPEKYRAVTLDWLKRYLVKVDALIMRPDGDKTGSEYLKIRLLEQWFGTKENVLERIAFCLDDRDKVVKAYRDYGLVCWQVREGAY